MNKQQMQFIDTCEVCNAFQTKDQVTDPGQKLGLIFFYWIKEHYLVLVDYYAHVIALPQG